MRTTSVSCFSKLSRVIDDYSMAPSDGDFVLDKALKLQHQPMDGIRPLQGMVLYALASYFILILALEVQ